ncbi:kinetochore protein NDC80 homolog [Schistocerca piceifrons]|uniref:kinetochore protein NDC80 homolog n=1 Tax=Schistocerca piceifrons TaxID=274613 RepID=UPI001F5FA137|nr:kinetochore protein NDC80 homolog [Schistocerca piceifrons]
MALREIGSGRRAQSCDRKSALPVPLGAKHQRSSSVGPNTQCMYSTPLVRQNSAISRSSTRGTSARKFLGNVQFPTADREFQRYAVNKVRNYFQQNSNLNIRWSTFGSQPLSVATYVEMFNFLLKLLFKDTNLDTKNYVDELPQCMRALSYPVNIQKSSLHTMNTKNSWPSLLSMFVFLVDHVSLIDKSEVSEMVCPDSGDNQDFEVQNEVFWHSLKIYKIWNDYAEGDDERIINKENEALKEKLKKLHPVDEEDLNALEEEIKILEMELDKNNCSNLEEVVQMLQTKKNGLCNDEEMVQLEVNKLQNVKKERERQIEERENKLHLLEEYNNKKRKDIQRLEEICKTQEMTVEDKEKNLQECLELRQRIKDAEELCSSLKTSSYKTDQEIAKIKTEVDNPYVELKKFQCEKVNIPEVSGLKIGSRYNLEDWKYAKTELRNLKKQLVSKKLHLGKSSVDLKKEVSMWKEQLDQLLEDETNGKRHLQDLDECLQKLRSDSKKIDTNIAKKEEELEKKQQILKELTSEVQSVIAELEDYKKLYATVVSEGEQKIKEEEEELEWMKENLLEVKKDFIEKSGWTDIKL